MNLRSFMNGMPFSVHPFERTCDQLREDHEEHGQQHTDDQVREHASAGETTGREQHLGRAAAALERLGVSIRTETRVVDIGDGG